MVILRRLEPEGISVLEVEKSAFSSLNLFSVQTDDYWP